MSIFKYIASLSLCCLTSLALMAQSNQKVEKTLTKNQAGKYIFTLKTKTDLYHAQKSHPDVKYWIKTDLIPIGARVTVINPSSQESRTAQVVDTLKDKYDKRYAYINTSPGLDELYPRYTKYDHPPVIVTYETPIDSVLRLIPTQPIAQQVSAYQSLCGQFKKYMTQGYHRIPPVDSLAKIARQLKGLPQASVYSFLASFVKVEAPQQALNYLQQALAIAQQQGDKNQEAQYWVRIGNLRNTMVNKITFDLKYGSHTSRIAQAKRIAQKEGYQAADIIRWSKINSYFYFSWSSTGAKLHPFDNEEMSWGTIRCYPDVSKFSDLEYLKYLEIKQAQNQTDQIAWILKRLGDLYRITTGYGKAEVYYKKLLALRKKEQNTDKIAWVWACLADLYWEQRKFEQAKVYFKKIHTLRKNNRDFRRQVWALGGLRYLSRVQGKLTESLDYQRQIFRIYQQLPYDERRRWVIYFILDLYREMYGTRQEEFMNNLISWHQKNRQHTPQDSSIRRESSKLVEEIVSLADKLQKHKVAAQYLLLNIPSQTDTIHQIRLTNDVAFYYQKAKAYKLAKKYYKQGLNKARSLNNDLLEAIQYYKLGYFYDRQSKSKKANRYYQKSLKTLQKIPNNSIQTSNNSSYLQYVEYLRKGKEYPQVFSTLVQIPRYFYQTRKDPKRTLAFLDQYIRVIKNKLVKRRFEDLKVWVESQKK